MIKPVMLQSRQGLLAMNNTQHEYTPVGGQSGSTVQLRLQLRQACRIELGLTTLRGRITLEAMHNWQCQEGDLQLLVSLSRML